MNKIHSCTEARPAAACFFLSFPGTGWFLGCLRDGVAWRGGGLTPESFAGSRCGGSHRLTHLRLLPEIAAQQLAPLWNVTAVPPRRGPLRVPWCHPPWRGGVGAQTAPGVTPGGIRAFTTPAPTRGQPRQHTVARLSPAPGTRVSLRRWPQPRTDTGQPCAAHRGRHRSQERGWGGGAGADVPPCPHTGPTVPPAPRWHVPAQNPRRLAGAGGVTRTRCPCTHPHGRGDWSRGPGAGGGGSRHPLSCHLHPVPAPPILPPAQLPAVCGGGCGGEGGAGSCSPQDGWVELNPICFIIGHKARSPGCSPAG